MLEYFIPGEETRTRMVRNYLAPCILETACRFYEERYQAGYARGCLLVIMYFGDWLQQQALPLCQVTAMHAHEFLGSYVPPTLVNRPLDVGKHIRRPVYAAVRRAMAWIQEHHAIVIAPTPTQREVEQYTEHLRRNRGLREGTIGHHCRGLQAFLSACFGDGEVQFSTITAERVHSYFATLPRTRGAGVRRRTCSALRGYFRFLEMRGISTRHIITGVPVLPYVRSALSPKVLTMEDMNTLLGAVDDSKATGKRTYATIMCLSDLGMRVGDVARLSLDDIDWRQGTVRIANYKQGRSFQLPLPKRVGKALAEYLANGRPESTSRAVFVQHARPVGMPITAHALKTEIRRVWERSGLHETFSGTHILRHSAATRMKQEGIPLKSIADVLGHTSLQTTVLYAQVDAPALRRTAQPWPGGSL